MLIFLILIVALLVMGCPGVPPAVAVAALIVYCWAVYDTVRADAAADAKAADTAKRDQTPTPARSVVRVYASRRDGLDYADYTKMIDCLGCPGPGSIGCSDCDDCGKITGCNDRNDG